MMVVEEALVQIDFLTLITLISWWFSGSEFSSSRMIAFQEPRPSTYRNHLVVAMFH
jgi:hypothetical protein